jgi:hypothetical protein
MEGDNFECTNPPLDSLPVGSKIEKAKWKLDYMIDGKIEHFNDRFCTIMPCIGMCLVTAGLISVGYHVLQGDIFAKLADE